MRLAIDCRSLRKKPAGVPNLLINFINTLATQEKNWTLYLLSNEAFDEEVNQRLVVLPHVHVLITPLPAFNLAILWYVLKLPWILKKLQPDLFFTPIPNLPPWLPKGIRTMVEVNDMVYKHYPQTMSRGNWWINFFLHNRSICVADFLWAISHYTKQEIEQLYPQRRSREIVVGVSVDKQLFRRWELSEDEKRKLKEVYCIGDKTILFVGTLEPRKNLQFLLSLMPELSSRGFSLLIIGAKGWGNELPALPPRVKDHVHFAGFVPKEDLVMLYQLVTLFVSTSLNEGFGLPQLEAMCCGCPVISPHNSAMIEIVEGAGETVKGWSHQQWIDTIEKVMAHREEYVSRGYQRAAQFQWDEIVARLVKYIAL